MIVRNELPLLEYDTSSREVIAPNHDCTELRLPEKCLFAFLGSTVDRYAGVSGAESVQEYVTIAQSFQVYVLKEAGEKLCLVQSPIGAPAATAFLDMLIACGCRKILAAGSCGVLTDIPENAFLIPVRALRAEGTSCHYLPAARFIELDPEPVQVLERTFRSLGLTAGKCTTWSTDGYFRETADMVSLRISEGCSVVEMECSALAACARKRGALFGEFLFTADSLANVHSYDARDFGYASHEKALLLGLEALRDWN